MLRIAAAIALLGLSGIAHATCYGTQAVQNCYDPNTGNSYSVQRYGSQTNVQGYNATTGSNWSQTSTTIGSTTYTNGSDSQGRPWTETQTRIGNTVNTYGTNAAGQPFSDSRYVPANDDE
jgi:hypothetical protein